MKLDMKGDHKSHADSIYRPYISNRIEGQSSIHMLRIIMKHGFRFSWRAFMLYVISIPNFSRSSSDINNKSFLLGMMEFLANLI